MLSWIMSWFRKKEVEDVSELYTAKQRNIYGFFAGQYDQQGNPVMTWADPMVLWKKLMDNGPELSVRIKVAFSESKGNIKAHTDLVKQIREVFGVKPLEEGGLTEVETVDLLNHFLTYIGQVKKNSKESQIVRQVATSPTSGSPTKDSPVTENTLDSTSTENVRGSVKQEPLPSVPELQSGP